MVWDVFPSTLNWSGVGWIGGWMIDGCEVGGSAEKRRGEIQMHG